MLKKLALVSMLSLSVIGLVGCNSGVKMATDLKEKVTGLDMNVKTYNEDSQVIDSFSGKSISIQKEGKFEEKDAEGSVTRNSSVINLTVGGKEIIHVGSSLIAKDKRLYDVFDDYSKTADFKNTDRSIPIINRMVNNFKNMTTGKKMMILIRSQSGMPLATFEGDSVSYYSSDVDKATEFIIDGKYLFVYRCDYSIYEKDLLD